MCVGARKPDRFLVGRPSGPAAETAARYCAECPVRSECLAHARATGSQGIWGGWWFATHGYGEPVDLLGRSAG